MQTGHASQRKINKEGENIRCYQFLLERHRRDSSPQDIARLPDHAIPNGPVVEAIIHIQQERRPRLQYSGNAFKARLSVGQVMHRVGVVPEYAEIVAGELKSPS